ncbi:enoyl-CoA hydratase [Knoellia sinensis KCTC 19936]|uniref:Enoyl-CoA hydratase n=1 Tax=Knoellia sinensis KCTC 19936 TaxID=1385520 RepID=A0A0A0J4I1_9MICO|nr:enoyl-CoA hydratase-related protein [Knoellia sinensis]KGN32108.1 enoyl-CoA hydratase [Knoellia sinensis KCTC 19936]
MTSESYEQVAVDVTDAIATVTLNRPEARNGYTIQMADELALALRDVDADDAVRAVVLTGAGTDFCVGADLSGGRLDVTDGADSGAWVEPATRATSVLHRMHKPVVTASRGAAVGVGSTLQLAADIRIASTDSRFGFVFARRGIFPEGGSSWYLPRIVGQGRALEWLLTGRLITADEALATGLVNELVAPDEVLARATEVAAQLATLSSPVSMAVIRRAVREVGSADSPDAAFALDSRLIAGCATSKDAHEGVLSFLERRDPVFPLRVSTDQPDHLPWHD